MHETKSSEKNTVTYRKSLFISLKEPKKKSYKKSRLVTQDVSSFKLIRVTNSKKKTISVFE